MKSSPSSWLNRNQSLILAAAFVRALGIGLTGVLLALYLSKGGLRAGQIGALVGIGLAGLAGGTLFVSFFADALGRRNSLLLLAGCTAGGAAGLVLFPGFYALLPVAFFGMVNAMGRERGPLFTLEQAVLPATTDDRHRTTLLAWYNLVLDVGMALGSLSAVLPVLLRDRFGLSDLSSYRWLFAGYLCLCLLNLLLYLGLDRGVEVHGPTPWHHMKPESRRIITRLSLLFGLDSLAGGFVPGALLAYFFFRRFGVSEEVLAPLFFTAHALNAVSYLISAWLARRIGLVKTMVFTHIPANLFMVAVAFVPSFWAAVVLYLLRESMVEMDVPARQSYVMAMVEPGERTLASGITNLTRTAAWSVGPGLAGWAMGGAALGLPLVVCGGLKVVYDLCLYRSFRHQKPPEERCSPC